MDLAWLPSCVGCPPLLNLWTRCRLVPDPNGGSGVDIVSFLMLLVSGRVRVAGIDVSLLSVLLLLCMRLGWVFW